MNVVVQHNLDALTEALKLYAEQRKMPIAEALTKKGKDLSFRLYGKFRALSPKRGSIEEAAKSRNYRTRISGLALKRADRFMTGQSRILGSVTSVGLRTVRLGKKGQLIKGGRFGTKGNAAPLSIAKAYSALARFTSGATGGARESEMNRTATAMFYELRKREAARGFLAVSWLPAVWSKVARYKGGGWTLVRRNKTGTVLSLASQSVWEGKGSAIHRFELTSMVKAATKYPGAIASALEDTTRDIAKYFSDRGRETLAKTITDRLRNGVIR